MTGNGDFVITWQSYWQVFMDYGIYAQRYDIDGNPLGGEFEVNTQLSDDQEFPSAAMSSTGEFVISWQSDGPDGSDLGIFR